MCCHCSCGGGECRGCTADYKRRDTSQRMTLVAMAVAQTEWAAGVLSAQEAMIKISSALDRNRGDKQMRAFAAWHTAGSYSVVVAPNPDVVWDEADAKGVTLLAVTELPRNGDVRRGKLRKLTIEI